MLRLMLLRHAKSDWGASSLDDIDSAFSEDRFSHLKYSQRYDLPGKGAGISVTPYVAGHMLGGTIWKIQKDTEDIVYAVDCNKTRERLLKRAAVRPPSVRARHAPERAQSDPRRARSRLYGRH